MSGPHGPNDAPGPGEGRNDPTQVWGGQQPPGAAPQWGSQPPAQPANDPQQTAATQKWGGDQGGQQWQPAAPQQQWSQPQPQPQQPQPQQWGDQTQQQWGQQPPPQQWGDPAQQQWGDPNQQQQQQQWSQPQPQAQQPQPQQWGQQPQAQSGQWGQPSQQQWGAQAQPQQSGGGKKTGLIVGLALLGVVVVAGVVVAILMLTAKDELDQAAVQTGVAKVLEESYGIEDVKDVSCPAGQEVAVDATFTCDLKVGGEDKKVNIKITKEDGTYEVGRPS
ncbi:DUF4333 domain-containing protein [Nocardia carnea]|uniref:DUF4333 domain-containing protein n=1 Tax=Nocardia carnea TaxID=37328 RepID=UPI002458454A|nr:DUF4333 domain-containing protein [Nocardia carnea]